MALKAHPPPTPDGAVVDVGMPTLGESKYLVEAVESIFAQSYSCWRLLISENGVGNDNLRDALAPFIDDPRVHHLVSGERVSLARSWTRLVRASSAPYFAMLHDDDRWKTEFLQRRVEFLDDHPTCGFVFSGHWMIDEYGTTNGRLTLKLHEGLHKTRNILPQLFEYNLVGPPTAMFRRTAFEAVGNEYRDVLLTDHDMVIRQAAQFDVGFLSGWDSEYRIYDGQTSATRRLELGQAHLEVIESVGDVPVPDRTRRRIEASAHVCCALDNVELGERRRTLSHLRDAVRADPSSILRPGVATRMLIAIIALAFGDRGRRRFVEMRLRRFQERSTGMSRVQRNF